VRLLFISHRVPYPPDKGERLRAFHEIRALSGHFRVTVAALAQSPRDEESAKGLAPFCEKVVTVFAGGRRAGLRALGAILAGRSATEGYFHSRDIARRLLAAAGGPFELAMGYCSSTLPYLLAAPARSRVLDLVDVDSAKWADYAKASRWPRSWAYRRESAAVSKLEQSARRRCDAVLAVTAAEAGLLGEAGGRVLAVGNGVDSEYFAPPPATTLSAAPPRRAPALVFTGTMDYLPNVQAVVWFAGEVFPRLRRRFPGLEFHIVGRDPAPEVRRLASAPGVVVTGGVPDVRPYLAAASSAVCPLLIARGIQNKVLEAMAMARPVVASGPALEGLDLRIGQEALRADEPGEWEERIAGLLERPDRAEEIGQAARRRVVERYAWDASLRPMVELCLRLASGSREGVHER
jgi:polysaccharide biosynthesis protein PslH